MKNRQKPEISIIMGVYNPEKRRLFQAVHSIMRQSFDNWEMLLYDDGSDEAFARIIRKAAALDSRIQYIRDNQNHGLSHALNECLFHAEGQYIARMDDDDIAAKDRLQKQSDFLDAHPQFQWVGSNAELMDENGIWGYQKMPETPSKRDFLFNSPYIHPTVMFRREVLLKNRGYSTARRNRGNEDYELFMRLHSTGNRGYNLQEPLLQYWESYTSYRKRTYQRRIREMKVRSKGFQELGILNKATFPYVLKPLLVGAVPAFVHYSIRRKRKVFVTDQSFHMKG
ncbi:MAG: glycosyltransferase [Candidatus Merdivicinus sp.]|jgi:glycosyltransferase EpsE